MTTPAFSVTPSTPLKDVARLLVDHRISGVPVVAEDGSVLGVVSEADFLLKEGGIEVGRRHWYDRILGEDREAEQVDAKIEATTAGEAMTSPATTVDAARSTTFAAKLMVDRAVNRLPVVEDGRLVGIVSRADLVRAFVQSDEQLADAIRQDVLLKVLWLDPALFDVDVRNGVASISGRVSRRSMADMVERAIRNHPGIVDVETALTWELDDDEIKPASRDMIFPYSPR